ncbi:hypothetical protein [Rhodopirellula sp. P2]|uniref:hypothetical protein n=1 Tax=Rhodopirellula sp. P2 TaxID=2127060 RepID=UPI002367E459|nr:hypothetical protein [Rhodopirellula sp. P2]WDQ14946.1 hypothetical protein PSR62_15000 [Rhodopirellula sp. P2]
MAFLICGSTTALIAGAILGEINDVTRFEGARGYMVGMFAFLGSILGPIIGIVIGIKNAALQGRADYREHPSSSRSGKLLYWTAMYTLGCGLLAFVPVTAYSYIDLISTVWILAAIVTSVTLAYPCYERNRWWIALLAGQCCAALIVPVLWLTL